MADKSGISWTDATWNPIVGCSIVSPGCTNCYAMQMANRIERMQPTSHYAGTTKVVNGNPVWTGKMVMAPKHILLQPLKWKRPRRIFVNSMSDLFHDSVPDEWIDKVFAVMALSPQHTFQVLTKRSKRMRQYISQMSDRWILIEESAEPFGFDPRAHDGFDWLANKHFSPNVHLGVSCEDQTRADERIPDLLATPAAARFVSAEPLLGPIVFQLEWLLGGLIENGSVQHPQLGPIVFADEVDGLDQIIVGGESGPGHRPMQIEWAESIMRQCREAGTAFFFKQDSGPRSGMKGRASDELWACKQMVEDR